MTEVKKILTISFLRTIALIVVSLGALSALGFLLNKGRHTPIILLVLYVGWVLSPFVGLLVADKIFKSWSVSTRVIFYCLMLILTLVSLVVYSGALTSTRAKPAAIFLIVSLTSWLPIVTFILIAQSRSRRNSI